MSAAPDEPTANFERTKMVGALIRGSRKDSGLSREDVTKLTGVSVHALYLIENGERKDPETGEMSPYRTSTATLVKLARALNITTMQLEAVKRPDAAVALLTEHLKVDGLDETTKRQLIVGLRKLSDALPNFAQLMEWVGAATGSWTPPGKRPDGDA